MRRAAEATFILAFGFAATGCVADLDALMGGRQDLDSDASAEGGWDASDGSVKLDAPTEAGLEGAAGSTPDASETVDAGVSDAAGAGDAGGRDAGGNANCPTCSLGLALYWKFDEAAESGVTAIDSSGNRLNGLYTGLVGTPIASPSVPPFGTTNLRSRAFSKVNQHAVQLENMPPLLKPENNLTVAVWYRATTTDTNASDLVSAGDQYQLRLNLQMPEWTKQAKGADGLPYWARCMAPQGNYRDGAWHHLAAVTSPAGMALYFDGALICQNAEGGSIVYNKGPHLWVGRHGNMREGYNFDGNLDEVRVYTRVLSADEIRSLALGAGLVDTDGGTKDGGADAAAPDAPADAGAPDAMDAGKDGPPAEAAPPQTPYGGTAWPIPGTIEAENYDVGGEGISFHDTTPGNSLAQFRAGANEDVDIEKQCGSGCYDVSAVVAGEWTEYTVNVTTSGVYKVGLNVAAAALKRLHIEIDGVNVTGTLTVTSTGSNTIFLDQNPAAAFTLTAGQKTMRIVFEDGSVNVNWVKFLLQ